jgi:hypothetical protein
VQLIVTADVGPRVIFFGFIDGDNEFHEFADQVGKSSGGEGQSYGGHRLWVAPELDRTYWPDNVPVRVVHQGNVVKFIGAVESSGSKASHMQREIDIELADSGSHVMLTHKISNHGQATQMAPWAISVMEQNGRAILPFVQKAPWGPQHLLPESLLALWSYTDFSDPRWKLSRKYVQLRQDPNATGELVKQKVGIYARDGWGAYFRNGHLFVKHTDVKQGAHYPDYGCNFETYTDPGFLELESLGPLQTLAAGATATHIERWSLFKDVPAGEDDNWVDNEVLSRVKQ